MSEPELACPVCGQRLVADPRTLGAQLECPACFQQSVLKPDTDLQDKLARLGRFLQAVCHDEMGQIGTAIDMNLIALATELMRCSVDHRYTTEIQNEINRLEQALDRLRRFSSWAHLRSIGKAPDVDAEDLYNEALATFANQIRPSVAEIDLRLSELHTALGPSTPAHRRVASTRNELAHLDEVAKGALEFAGVAKPKLSSVDIASFVAEVGDLLASYLRAHGIRLATELQTDLRSQADTQQLKHVLNELIQNAADNLGEGGTVTLRGRNGSVVLGGLPTQAVFVEVEDTGSGIPSGVQSQIFEPFFSTKPGRIGLGLARAARIIKNHSGILSFETQEGKGTVFRLTLPAET
jgi:signal transduction histidine kinase